MRWCLFGPGSESTKRNKRKEKKTAPNARSYFRSPLRRGYAAYIYIVFLLFSGCYAEGYAAYIYIYIYIYSVFENPSAEGVCGVYIYIYIYIYSDFGLKPNNHRTPLCTALHAGFGGGPYSTVYSTIAIV